MNPAILEARKNQFLLDFIMTKPLAAMILTQVQVLVGLKICSGAVKKELLSSDLTRAHIHEHSKSPTDWKRDFYIFYSEMFVKFTLVCHPVGLHLDVLSDKLPLLENIICFSFDNNTEYLDSFRGRGGCGQGKYVFALLDWTGVQVRRRQVWIDPANRHLPLGPDHYYNADIRRYGVVLTAARWREFFERNGHRLHFPGDFGIADL